MRFFRFVDIRDDGCWWWTGTTGGSNARYGYFNPTTSQWGKKVPAHRWLYEAIGNFIPDGLELDHLCRNKLCVNPAHLEPVTHAENRKRSRLTRCRKDLHDLTDPANCRWDSKGQRRGCLQCWLLAAEVRGDRRRR